MIEFDRAGVERDSLEEFDVTACQLGEAIDEFVVSMIRDGLLLQRARSAPGSCAGAPPREQRPSLVRASQVSRFGAESMGFGCGTGLSLRSRRRINRLNFRQRAVDSARALRPTDREKRLGGLDGIPTTRAREFISLPSAMGVLYYPLRPLRLADWWTRRANTNLAGPWGSGG